MIRIDSDLFDIAQRLKAIDSGYVLYYNPKRSKYQLYKEQKGKEEYQLTFPFDSLDARCITHCLKTRVERAKKLLEELAKQNQINKQNQLYHAKKQMQNKAENYLRKL